MERCNLTLIDVEARKGRELTEGEITALRREADERVRVIEAHRVRLHPLAV